MAKPRNFLTIFLIICVVVLFFLAAIWEIRDIIRIWRAKRIDETADPKEKEKMYIFYSTLPYENGVTWRMLFIPAVVAALLLYFVLNNSGYKLSLETSLIIFFIIFFVYYFFDNFKSYHFWRVAASKVQPRTIL